MSQKKVETKLNYVLLTYITRLSQEVRKNLNKLQQIKRKLKENLKKSAEICSSENTSNEEYMFAVTKTSGEPRFEASPARRPPSDQQ